MLRSSPAHAAAVLAAALLAAGALGPWATGLWMVDPIFEEPTYVPREERGGFLLLVPAALAAASLLFVREPRWRGWAAAGCFAASAAVCLAAWGDDAYALGWSVHVFEGWASVGPGWGLILATIASAGGFLAALATLPRADAWKGAHF